MVPSLKYLMRYMWLHYEKYSSAFKSLDNQCVAIDFVGEAHNELAEIYSAEIEVDGRNMCGKVLFFDKLSEWNGYVTRHNIDMENIAVAVVNIIDVPSATIAAPVLKCTIDPELMDRVVARINSNRGVCINILSQIPSIYRQNTLDRLAFERLKTKTDEVTNLFVEYGNWEGVFIKMLFMKLRPSDILARRMLTILANNVNIGLIVNELHTPEDVEAYVFGVAGLLHGDSDNKYLQELLGRYRDICNRLNVKYSTTYDWRGVNMHKLFDNMSQLAALLSKHISFIAQIAYEDKLENIYKIFSCEVSNYWKNHRDFSSNEFPNRRLTISKNIVDRYIINVVIPTVMAYHNHLNIVDDNVIEKMVTMLRNIKGESYKVIKEWSSEGLNINDAYESQAILQLDKVYCKDGRCLECILFESI